MGNAIGEFQFVALFGDFDVPKTRLAVEERAGVDGSAIWDQGEHGRPFKLESLVDCESLEDGRDTFESYRQAIGGDPVVVEKSGVLSSGSQMKCAILDVSIKSLRQARTIVGGISTADGDDGAILVCTWDLLPIADAPSNSD